MSLLETINLPPQLRAQPQSALIAICDELRAFVLDSVSKTGGHLSSNLGVVELSVALHYCFDTPHDRLVWDVGHQCYPHKVLTGRRDRMHTLRQWGGLAGFPKRDESEYDTFGVAHSSTSISAALGMAVAAKAKGEHRRVVAVIGDGAMSAGMAFEALNNAGAMDANVLVILNDNEMSISEPVGALNNYLSRLLASRMYGKVRSVGKSVLSATPLVSRFARRWEEHMKGMVLPGTLWEELGFNYIGPIDGHDVNLLVDTLNNLKDRQGPQFLHVLTKKGGGYGRAEDDPILYHSVPKFDHVAGISAILTMPPKKTYSDIFGDWLCDTAATDDRLVAITPAMREGSGMVRYSKEFPERYFDVGIAEQHSVTFAAGLACEGMKPVVAIYSTFLQRAYDQLVHDVVLQNLPVVFAIDRAGLVGSDGPTHAGTFDVAYLRCLPNMTLMSASSAAECRAMLSLGIELKSPVAVRYPRGAAQGAANAEIIPLELGKGEVRRVSDASGGKIAILAWGSMLLPALAVGDKLNATVVNMRFVKPLDETLIRELAASHGMLVTVEEASVQGSAGGAVAEFLARAGLAPQLVQIGLPDTFIDQGDPAMMLASVGLDATGIEATVRAATGPAVALTRAA